jgi:hypothetical protein
VAGLVIVNISTKLDNNSLDMTWQLAPVIIWASVEVNLVTISGMTLYFPDRLCHTNSLPQACLPIIRPACLYLFSCQNPMPSSVNSISNNYGRGCTRSQIKQSIRLGTMPKEESSSTHELARPEQRGRDSFSSDFGTDNDRRHRNITTAIGLGSSIDSQNVPRLGGIMVTSETVVHVSNREYSC